MEHVENRDNAESFEGIVKGRDMSEKGWIVGV